MGAVVQLEGLGECPTFPAFWKINKQTKQNKPLAARATVVVSHPTKKLSKCLSIQVLPDFIRVSWAPQVKCWQARPHRWPHFILLKVSQAGSYTLHPQSLDSMSPSTVLRSRGAVAGCISPWCDHSQCRTWNSLENISSLWRCTFLHLCHIWEICCFVYTLYCSACLGLTYDKG